MSLEYRFVWTANGTKIADFSSRTGSISFGHNKRIPYVRVRDIRKTISLDDKEKGLCIVYNRKHCLTSISPDRLTYIQHIPAAFQFRRTVMKYSRYSNQLGTTVYQLCASD